MKSVTIILLVFLACSGSKAQSKADPICGGIDSILSRKGKWKKEVDANPFPDKTFPRTQYKLVHTRVDSIFSLVKGAVTDLSGTDPFWLRNINGQSNLPNGPVPYEFNAYFLIYYCNTNVKKILLGDETGTVIHVFVNRLSWFLYDADSLDIDNNGVLRQVFQLPPKAGKIKGMTVYKFKSHQFFDASGIIIGRNGKVPWKTITQKQYLTGLKIDYEKHLTRFKSGSGYEKDYTTRLKYIKDYLAITNEQTLAQPAIIDPKSGIWGFKGKFGDEDEGGFRLVLWGGGDKFFDTSLPRYVPQLIEVYWSYGRDEISRQIRKQIEENFPFDKLKAMIDK